jgi:hypothetical protein
MKYFLISLLILSSLTSQAQNKDGAVLGATAVAAGIAVAMEIHRVYEALELFGTQHILGEYPEIDEFTLKLNTIDGLKLADLSGVGLLTYNVSLGAVKEDGQERFVLAAFLDPGWMNSYGVDVTRVTFVKWDKTLWNEMMLTFIKTASGLPLGNDVNMIPEYDKLSEREAKKTIEKTYTISGSKGRIDTYVNSGTTAPIEKLTISQNSASIRREISNGEYAYSTIVPFRKIKGDSYIVKSHSDDFVLVYNERSLGLYLKETGRLVQLKSTLVRGIHYFVNEQ